MPRKMCVGHIFELLSLYDHGDSMNCFEKLEQFQFVEEKSRDRAEEIMNEECLICKAPLACAAFLIADSNGFTVWHFAFPPSC